MPARPLTWSPCFCADHVTDLPPFTVGCFGPSADGSFVSPSECRTLYDALSGQGGCGGEDESTWISSATGTVEYDRWCPCFASSGSNTVSGLAPQPATVLTLDLKAGWSWFSLNIVPTSWSIQEVLKQSGTENDIIKSQNAFARHYGSYGCEWSEALKLDAMLPRSPNCRTTQ